MRTIALVVSTLGLLQLLSACGPAPPTLEMFDDAESRWVELGHLSIESMSVNRDGDTVYASGVFLRDNDRVTLTVELVVDPTAHFIAGSHDSGIEGADFSGPVTAESVEFFGGQNEGPSVGGVFVFENPSDGARYRLRFPPTPRSR